MLKKWNNILSILGIATCLIAAFLMAFGETIIGTNHTGIATVVCITGLGLITTGNKMSVVEKKQEKL